MVSSFCFVKNIFKTVRFTLWKSEKPVSVTCVSWKRLEQFVMNKSIHEGLSGGGVGGSLGGGGRGGDGGVVKGQKIVQNDKKFCLSHYMFQELYIIWLWFMVHIYKMMVSPAIFLILQNFDFWGFQVGKRAKNDLKLLISVCFALYLRNCSSYHQDFDNNIYRCFSLFF